MGKKVLILGLCMALVFSFTAPVQTVLEAAENPYLPPSEDWNQLQDFMIFDNPTGIDGWNYGIQWESSQSEAYNEKRSLRITTTGEWWAANLAVNGWQTADLLDYHQHGTLQFNVKGANGGEEIRIGFRDLVTERVYDGEFVYGDNGSHESTREATLNVSDYAPITSEWQHVSIPLADFINLDDIFDISKTQLFTVTQISQQTDSITVYLNDIKVVSPDSERVFPPIKVNQIGYILDSEKYAYISGFYNVLAADVGSSFQVRNASNDETVYSGKLSLISAYDPASGEKVLKADFSSLNQPGEYYVTVSGVEERSAAFQIGNDVFDPLLKDVQRFFFLQRANIELLEEHAGVYAREAMHTVDADLPLSNNSSITRDVSGGWYDAGDFGKYITAGATAVSELLWTYEMFPHIFYDGQMNIPESGNGKPDLLDEIKYELDFLLKMQEEESGGFYAYVIRDEAPNRYVMNRDDHKLPTAQTANTVGVLAHAALVYQEVQGWEAYAQALLEAARAGWSYLEANPEHIGQPSGPYNTNDNTKGRFYAAASLYRATGEEIYNNYVLHHYQSFASNFNDTSFSHGINGMEMMGYMHYLSAEQHEAEIMDWFIPKFTDWRDEVLYTINNEAVWRNAPNGFYWGANTNVLNVNLTNIVGSKIINDFSPDIMEAAAASLNYILGINPLQLSYVTGYGENHVLETHSGIFNKDWIVGMPKGFMPGGANGGDNRKISQFPGKAYNHSTIDWVSNEHALNYNAPLVFVAALLVAEANTTQQVEVTPIDQGGYLTIPHHSVYGLQHGGTLTIDWGESVDSLTELRFSKEQIKELLFRQATLFIQKNDILLELPLANFDGSEDVAIHMERVSTQTDYPLADEAKSAIYQLTIQVGGEIRSFFEEQIIISFPISEEEVENPEELRVYYWNPIEEEWQLIGGEWLDGYIRAATEHFSTFTVFDPAIFVENEQKTDQETDQERPANGGGTVELPNETPPPSSEEDTSSPDRPAQDGEELPRTASSVYTILLIGALLLSVGIVFSMKRVREKLSSIF